MERLTEQNNGANRINCDNCGAKGNCIIPNTCLCEITNRLADYEDAEEQGLLVRLPCKVGDTVWRVWITDGRKPLITEHYMSDLLCIVKWFNKFGKTVFLTREEAEIAMTKENI